MFKAVRILKNQSKTLFNYQAYQFGQIKTFILPDLGEKIKEATVKEWHVKVGDVVEEFQTIADVSTDKLFTQIPSSYDGKITKLYYEEEDIALIGEPFIDIEVEDGVADESSAPKQESSQQQQQETSQNQVQQEQEQPQIQRQREGRALAAPATRKLARDLNIDIDQVQGTGPEGRVTDQDVNNFLTNSNKRGAQLTPATRALAQQYNIDINDVQGTGKHGLVTKSDILEYVKNQEAKQQSSQTTTRAASSQGVASTFETETVKMTSFAQGMQKSMTASNDIPHLYIKEEIDMTESHLFREQLKKSGNKLTFMSIFVKAFSLALQDFPIINSVYDASNPFEYKIVNNHNITIAIASPHGLVVPNIKNVQNLNLLEVQDNINSLRVKADKGQLGPKELFEGSVSISNIGTVGGTYANPLIFAPQTSIVAIGRMQELPRYVDGQLVPRKIVNVSLGCDHRVIDGAAAAGFIMKWKQYLENPSQMLLRMK